MSPLLVSDKPNAPTAERSAPVRDALKRGLGFYKFIAIFSMNTIITLIVVNVLCHVVLHFWEKQDQERKEKLSLSLFAGKYHDYPVAQLTEILKEKGTTHIFEYAPYLGYKYRPQWRKYTHITPPGFRWSTDNGPWPPSANNLNVFVYGASTTFGPGVTDDQTIPAQLQEFLKGKCDKPVKTYNFGTSGYNSTMERIQFANMLAQGIIPDVAVFVDGNLDSQFYTDDPPLANEMRELMEDRGYGLQKAIRPFIHDLPMTKLWTKWKETAMIKKAGHPTKTRFNQAQSDHIIDRYSANKHLIEVQAKAFGVKTLFVWQPCASYKFNQKYHPFPEPDYSYVDMVPTYERMAQKVKQSSPEFTRDFLWLADIQEGATEPLYVDNNHYRANLCKTIGIDIGQSLLDRHLLAKDMTPPVESPAR